MSLQEIKVIEEQLQKEIDDLWELQSVLSSVRRVIEYFTKVRK